MKKIDKTDIRPWPFIVLVEGDHAIAAVRWPLVAGRCNRRGRDVGPAQRSTAKTAIAVYASRSKSHCVGDFPM